MLFTDDSGKCAGGEPGRSGRLRLGSLRVGQLSCRWLRFQAIEVDVRITFGRYVSMETNR